MTVRYKEAIATAQCGGFLKLLWRWEGSIYKLVWFELCVFLGFYAVLSLSYHFLMAEGQKRTFENIAQYCNKFSNMIPISFVLGFYVQRVINRFWEQFNTIPWPNRMAIYVSTYIQSNDERGRLMRRTIMRYICLSFTMTMSSISRPIKKRFPSLTHMTEAGFLTASEQRTLENMKVTNNKYFVPLIWATSVVARARKEGMIKSDLAMQKLIFEINAFRGGCSGLFSYDWVSIPLGYTQVVALAVYIFCLACLLGRYQLDAGTPTEKHFPFFTVLQFVFYMGWLKVAESGLGPFGEDDDDFDINLLIDRYLHESYMVVDEMFMKVPDMLKDQHWDLVDFDLPYTAAAAVYRKNIFLGSAIGTEVPADKQAFVPIETSHDTMMKHASSSRMMMSAASIRGKRLLKRKKTSIISEAMTESKESIVIPGGVSSIRDLNLSSKPLGQDVQRSDAAAGQQPVELKKSTSAGQQPVELKKSTSAGQQPVELKKSTSAGQQPVELKKSTSAGQQPVELKKSTSAGQQPVELKKSTSAGKQPSTSAEQQPSTSAEPQPSTSAEQPSTSAEQPSTSAEQQPSTSAGQQQSTLAEPQQDTSDTVLTQQESALMSKIQDELRELRK